MKETSSEKAETVKEITIQINIARFERSIGLQSKLNSTDAIALVNEFWKRYEDALPLGKMAMIQEHPCGRQLVFCGA